MLLEDRRRDSVRQSGLALGAHQIEIRASGYRAFSVEVTIDGNTKETFLLEPM